MSRASTTSATSQWQGASGDSDQHARWRFKGLISVERAFLYVAVFLAVFIPLRPAGIFFTASDLFYCGSLAILLLSGRLPSAPLGRATSLWHLSFFLLVFGLLGSSLLRGDPVRGFIVVGQYFFAYVLLLYIIVRNDPLLVNRLAATFVVSVLVLDVHGIFVFYTVGYTGVRYGVVTGGGRLATMLGNANLAALINALTLPLLLHMWHAGIFKNIVGAIGLAIIAFTVILTSSNSGLICLTFSALVFAGVVMNLRLIRRLIVMGMLGAFVLAFGGTQLLPAAFQQRVLGAVTTGDLSEAGTFDDRLALMEEAKAMIVQNGYLLFGLGADQYRQVSALEAPVHDVYLLVWTEGGLSALLGWLAVFVVALGLGVSARKRRTGAYEGGTLIAIVLVFLVGATFSPHMYARHYLTPVMLGLALVMNALRSTTEVPKPLAASEPPPPAFRSSPRRRNGGGARQAP